MLTGRGYFSNSYPLNNVKTGRCYPTHPIPKNSILSPFYPIFHHTTKFLLHKHIVFYHHFLKTNNFLKFIYKVQTFPHQYDDLVPTTVYIIYIIYSLGLQYDSCVYQKIIFIVFYAAFYMNFSSPILQSL